MRLEQSWCSHANGFLCSLGLQRHPASRGRMNTACLKKHTNTQSFWSQSHSFWSHCPGTGGAFCWGLPADTEQPGSHRPAQLYVQVKIHFTGIRYWKFVFYVSVIHQSLPVYWTHAEWVVSTFVCAKHCGTFLSTKQMFKHHHLVVDISIQTTKHDTTK